MSALQIIPQPARSGLRYILQKAFCKHTRNINALETFINEGDLV